MKLLDKLDEQDRERLFFFLAGLFLGGGLVWLILVPVTVIATHLVELGLLILVCTLFSILFYCGNLLKTRQWKAIAKRLRNKWVYIIPIGIALIIKITMEVINRTT